MTFASRARQLYNKARHREEKIMSGKDPRDLQQFAPSVVRQKSRLVVSFFFRKHEHSLALTKLYREFLANVMDKARNRGLGCPSEESFHNQDALKDLVGMYNLGTAIESAWSSKLGQREKLNLEREIGDETRRLEYALHVAAQCLEMSIVIGSELSIDGEKALFNEVTKEMVPLPIIDELDMVYLPVYHDLDLGNFSHIMVDEMQDLTRILYLFVQQLTFRGANLLMVGDYAQSLYLWSGGDLVRTAIFR